MNTKQTWMTIALDLKRAANYLYTGRQKLAEHYLGEAKRLYESQKVRGRMRRIERYIIFQGQPEDILLGSSMISVRV